MKKKLVENLERYIGCVKLLVDNRSTIALMKNLVFHGKSKHINTGYIPFENVLIKA